MERQTLKELIDGLVVRYEKYGDMPVYKIGDCGVHSSVSMNVSYDTSFVLDGGTNKMVEKNFNYRMILL